MYIKIEIILIILSILFFLSILAGRISSKLGIPALFLFLGIGMLFGSDGLGIQFDNYHITSSIGTIALCIILFAGGLETKISEIKPIATQGILLATIGVVLTAFFSGLIIWWVLDKTLISAGIGFTTALLMAATMSSTDSASVFSILRSKNLKLKHNLRPILELESGSNDPMAYILVITIIEILKVGNNINYWDASLLLILQLIIGAISGYVLAKISVYCINKIKIGNDSLYPILLFTFCIFIFSFTYFVKGNSYLAVYLGGLVIGNSKFIHKRTTLKFFDGLAWLSQLIMFLTLGLLVNPHELLPIIIPGLIISLLIIFFIRPLSVFITLLPFRKMSFKSKTYISWVGLRGAVPIIFAIMTLAENIPNARLIFNIVFFCTLVSLIIQGTTISSVANWLGLSEKSKSTSNLKDFDLDFSDEIKSVTSEIEIDNVILSKGNRLIDLNLPDKTLAVMVKRGDNYFIPTGKTHLNINDKLLIITDNQEALNETLENLSS